MEALSQAELPHGPNASTGTGMATIVRPVQQRTEETATAVTQIRISSIEIGFGSATEIWCALLITLLLIPTTLHFIRIAECTAEPQACRYSGPAVKQSFSTRLSDRMDRRG